MITSKLLLLSLLEFTMKNYIPIKFTICVLYLFGALCFVPLNNIPTGCWKDGGNQYI